MPFRPYGIALHFRKQDIKSTMESRPPSVQSQGFPLVIAWTFSFQVSRFE